MIGWLSTLCFSLCALPEAYSAYKTGKVGATWGLLLLWLIGEILGIIYILPKADMPILTNYITNTTMLIYIIYKKVKEKLSE